MTDLDMLYSARNPEGYVAAAMYLRTLPRARISESVMDRALEVQRGLDLVIAACAESADLTVLHYDADYERIAEVTGQPVQ